MLIIRLRAWLFYFIRSLTRIFMIGVVTSYMSFWFRYMHFALLSCRYRCCWTVVIVALHCFSAGIRNNMCTLKEFIPKCPKVFLKTFVKLVSLFGHYLDCTSCNCRHATTFCIVPMPLPLPYAVLLQHFLQQCYLISTRIIIILMKYTGNSSNLLREIEIGQEPQNWWRY